MLRVLCKDLDRIIRDVMVNVLRSTRYMSGFDVHWSGAHNEMFLKMVKTHNNQCFDTLKVLLFKIKILNGQISGLYLLAN